MCKRISVPLNDNFSLFSMAYSWGGFESLILANQPEQIAHIRPDLCQLSVVETLVEHKREQPAAAGKIAFPELMAFTAGQVKAACASPSGWRSIRRWRGSTTPPCPAVKAMSSGRVGHAEQAEVVEILCQLSVVETLVEHKREQPAAISTTSACSAWPTRGAALNR
jgi:hypothetical protein